MRTLRSVTPHAANAIRARPASFRVLYTTCDSRQRAGGCLVKTFEPSRVNLVISVILTHRGFRSGFCFNNTKTSIGYITLEYLEIERSLLPENCSSALPMIAWVSGSCGFVGRVNSVPKGTPLLVLSIVARSSDDNGKF